MHTFDYGVSQKVFHDVVYAIGERLLDVMNTSLHIGVFLESRKHLIVVPVLKINNTQHHIELRLIYTVPVYGKLLLLVVKVQLDEYCKKIELFCRISRDFEENIHASHQL